MRINITIMIHITSSSISFSTSSIISRIKKKDFFTITRAKMCICTSLCYTWQGTVPFILFIIFFNFFIRSKKAFSFIYEQWIQRIAFTYFHQTCCPSVGSRIVKHHRTRICQRSIYPIVYITCTIVPTQCYLPTSNPKLSIIGCSRICSQHIRII